MSATTLERPHAGSPTDGGHGRLRSLWRGRPQDPAWFRPLLILLLAATAGAYLIDLTVSNDANSFYAAAVQAGTKSWKAFFFGSIDASNFITVDKPPAFLWMMDLSGRIFGFSSASMLVPEVLEGVISVGLLASAVKRWYGAGAGLLAGALLALTPVAALMFRYNNPDALMVCLVVASAYCLVRSLEGASTKWLLGVGACLGFAFLAKMMEAFLVVPGFAVVYMIAAPTSVRRRATQLVGAGVAMLVCAGWWVAIVELWPAASRPMIDGSPSNSILNLIFDYNGFGRLTGNESGGGGRGGGANFSGGTGISRLFNDSMGAQASWMIPAALVVLVAGLIWCGRRPRTDRFRAGLLLFGSWLVVTGIVFSFSAGTIHTYYTVALAPPIAALAAIGAVELWRRREALLARGLLALIVALTAGWSVVLLSRDSSWESWLTPLVIVTGVVAIAALLAPVRFWSRTAIAVAVIAAVACLAAPVAYTADTITTAHTGSTPTAGPASAGGFGGGGFGGRAGGAGGFGGRAFGAGTGAGTASGTAPTRSGAGGFGATTTTSSALAKLLEASTSYRWAAATDGSQSAASLELASNGSPVMAIGGFSGLGGNLSLSTFETYVRAGDIHYYIAGSGGGGGFGGFGGGAGATSRTAATSGAGATGTTGSGASGSGLASLFGDSGAGTPGGTAGAARTGGFSRAGGGGFGGRSSSDASILTWVKAHYHSETVGGETIYNLSDPLS